MKRDVTAASAQLFAHRVGLLRRAHRPMRSPRRRPVNARPADAAGQRRSHAPELAAPRASAAPDSIDEDLVDAAGPARGAVQVWPGLADRPASWKQFNTQWPSVGLNVGFAYTAVLSGRHRRPRPARRRRRRYRSLRRLATAGRQGRPEPRLSLFRRRDTATTSAPASRPAGLGGEIGSLWGTTNGFGEQPLAVEGTLLAAALRRRPPDRPRRQARPGELLQQQLLAERQQILPQRGVLVLPRPRVPRQRAGHQRHRQAQRQWYVSTGVPGRARKEDHRRLRHVLRRLQSLQRRRGRLHADDRRARQRNVSLHRLVSRRRRNQRQAARLRALISASISTSATT